MSNKKTFQLIYIQKFNVPPTKTLQSSCTQIQSPCCLFNISIINSIDNSSLPLLHCLLKISLTLKWGFLFSFFYLVILCILCFPVAFYIFPFTFPHSKYMFSFLYFSLIPYVFFFLRFFVFPFSIYFHFLRMWVFLF